MTEINDVNSLNAHYTTAIKAELPKQMVAKAPDNIPKYGTYRDADANIRLRAINQDIYESEKQIPKKKEKKFLGIF